MFTSLHSAPIGAGLITLGLAHAGQKWRKPIERRGIVPASPATKTYSIPLALPPGSSRLTRACSASRNGKCD
jgi:hypothetical protein